MADEVPRKAKKKPPAASKSLDKKSAPKRKQLEASIRTQVAAEEKAHRIVEELVLESSISENYLIEIGNYITPSHYSDIIEERAIAKVCGYPLCPNALTQVPKQKYKISVKTNRVFDITERKNYCSNFCYKASKYFESQIPTSPVWTRIGESPKKLNLLKATDSSFKPNPGEILVGSRKLESHYNASENYDTEDISTAQSTKERRDNDVSVAKKLEELAISPSDIYDGQHTKKAVHVKETDLNNSLGRSSQREKNERTPGGETDGCSSPETKLKEISATEEETAKDAKEMFLNFIKETLMQWFTESTYRYLKMTSSTASNDDDERERKDKLNQNKTQNFTDRALRFLKTNKIKKGDGHDNSDDDTAAADDEDDKQSSKTSSKLNPEKLKITEKNTNSEEGFPIVVPPIDSKSQLTLRRQIVLQKLTQVLPEMLLKTTYNTSDVTRHFTALVKTFRLASRNTMFKPLQWKVLATSLVYLLEQRFVKEKDSFPSDTHSMEKILRRLGLTLEDMISIVDSLPTRNQDTTVTIVTSPETDNKPAESAAYSLMEDLD